MNFLNSNEIRYSELPWKDTSNDNPNSPLFMLPFRQLAVATVSLPLLAFIFCTLWSLWFDFERSTATHCHVPNYLPSISASIGGYTPQLYVWRVCIGLHAAPRFLVACMYGKFYKRLLVNVPFWQRLGFTLSVLHCVENSSLIGLTYVSSTDNFPAHEKFFVTFVLSAFLYMLLSCTVPRIASKRQPSIQMKRVLNAKLVLTLTNFTGAVLAVYFYLRHNNHCEPGVYTMFALCEYIVVLTNMAFHMCAFWDFGDQLISISGFTVQSKSAGVRDIHNL